MIGWKVDEREEWLMPIISTRYGNFSLRSSGSRSTRLSLANSPPATSFMFVHRAAGFSVGRCSASAKSAMVILEGTRCFHIVVAVGRRGTVTRRLNLSL
jgi:hypothetical protein